MTMISRNMKQQVTLWRNEGSDGFGGYSFSAPEVLPCRYEEKQVLFLNELGDEETSNAIVYTLEALAIGDRVKSGDNSATSDPTTIDTYIVKQTNRITDLRAILTEHKAFL